MRLRNAGAAAWLATGLVACGYPAAPHVLVPGLHGDLASFLAGHPLAADQAIRVDEVARTAAMSAHVVQARAAETPHRHRDHDLAVTVLRGAGTMSTDGAAVPVRPGDAALVPRGQVHWFAPAAGERAVALVVFAPPFDGRDNEPVSPADPVPR